MKDSISGNIKNTIKDITKKIQNTPNYIKIETEILKLKSVIMN
jgi:hypothetical protein